MVRFFRLDDTKWYDFAGVIQLYFKRIEDLRTDNDLTQIKVAKYLNMHTTVYRRYEKGVREIPVWALIKLSELYGVSVDYILGLTDNRRRA